MEGGFIPQTRPPKQATPTTSESLAQAAEWSTLLQELSFYQWVDNSHVGLFKALYFQQIALALGISRENNVLLIDKKINLKHVV